MHTRRLQEFGFQLPNIAVLDTAEADAYTDLPIDAIYISRGNPFQTLDRLKKCGFDKAIVRYVNNGVTYIGGSAGTPIATKNPDHVRDFDGYDTGLPDMDALGLFDGIIFCRYTKEREPFYKAALAKHRFPVYTLTDDESLIVDQ